MPENLRLANEMTPNEQKALIALIEKREEADQALATAQRAISEAHRVYSRARLNAKRALGELVKFRDTHPGDDVTVNPRQ